MLKLRQTKLRQSELGDKLAFELEKLNSYDTVESGLKGIRQLMQTYQKTYDFKLILSKLSSILDNIHVTLFNKENVVILLGFLASSY